MKSLLVFFCPLFLVLPLWADDGEEATPVGKVYYGLIIGSSIETPDVAFSVEGDGPSREGYFPLNNVWVLNSGKLFIGREVAGSGKARLRLQGGARAFHFQGGTPRYTDFELPMDPDHPFYGFDGDVNDHVSLDGRTFIWGPEGGLYLDLGDGYVDFSAGVSVGFVRVNDRYEAEILGHSTSGDAFVWTKSIALDLGLTFDKRYSLGVERVWLGPVDFVNDTGGAVSMEGITTNQVYFGIRWK